MQIVRTIVWVLLLVALLIFSINNWNPVEVKIWEGLVLETKIPALVVIAFLLGLAPMWLMHRISQWYYKRRLGSLENAARAAALATPAPIVTPSPAEPVAEPPHGRIGTDLGADGPDPVLTPCPQDGQADRLGVTAATARRVHLDVPAQRVPAVRTVLDGDPHLSHRLVPDVRRPEQVVRQGTGNVRTPLA